MAGVIMERDYYKILKLDSDASLTQIKKAYRQQALKFHPDKNPDDPGAEERFKKIGEAYSVLSDSKTRRKYDRYRDSQAYSDFSNFIPQATSAAFDLFSGGGGDWFTGQFGGGMNEAFNVFSRFMYEGGMAETFQGEDGSYLFVDVPLDIAKNGGNVLVTTPNGKTHRIAVDGIITGGWKPIRQLELDGVSYWVVFRVDFPDDMSAEDRQNLQKNLLFQQTVNFAVPLLLRIITEHPWWVAFAAGAVGLAAIALKK